MGNLLLLGPLARDHLGVRQPIGAVSPPQRGRLTILSLEPSEDDDDFALGQQELVTEDNESLSPALREIIGRAAAA